MQAKDVDEQAILDLVRECNEGICDHPEYTGYHGISEFDSDKRKRGHWLNRFDLGKLFPDVPEKVMLAKLRALIRKKKLDGCPCGCRGDLEIPKTPVPQTSQEP